MDGSQQHDEALDWQQPVLSSEPQPGHCPARSHFPAVLNALVPVLPLFHRFLTESDAARLLRSSHTTAITLLPCYAFTQHIFAAGSLASLHRLRRLCLRYGLRISQLSLPEHSSDITALSHYPLSQGQLSPIPPSVTALSLGPPARDRHGIDPRWAAFSAAASDWQDREPWCLPLYLRRERECKAEQRSWQLTWTSEADDELDRLLPRFLAPLGSLECPLPPGLLPSGLRVLQLSSAFNQPLQPGSLPSSLSFLQFGREFNQPVEPGVLPASLLSLSFTCGYHTGFHQPLVKGSLPPSLERLSLSGAGSQQLRVGVLPPSLRVLHLAGFNEPLRPGVLPASLQFLCFESFDQPLLPSGLPSSLVELRLGDRYNQALPPGVLPSSLRRLSVGSGFSYRQQLLPGSLPAGLQFLRFLPNDSTKKLLRRLEPGVLPSTLLGIDFSNRCIQPLPAGIIPPAVRWIRLSSRYRDPLDVQAVLPPLAECTFYENGDVSSWHIA